MSYKIPLFDLNFTSDEFEAVVQPLKDNWISTGPKCEEFERRFAEELDCNYALTLANCTTALHLAYELVGIEKDDEVICPSLTFVATVNAIRYVGATPVFCDIVGEEDLNIDPEKIENLITSKTKAIVVMHFAGFPVRMDRVISIAEKYNLKIIEDACHGPLSEYQGKKLGTIGDIGCFSFFSNKNISTGEGGMLVTNNKEYYDAAKLRRSHGMTTMSYQRASGHSTQYDVVALGYNYRMDDIRASLGLAQLKKLRRDLEKRTQVREYYLKKLADIDQLIIPFKQNMEFVSNYIMPVVLKDSTAEKRDALREFLHSNGIQTSNHYPPIHKFSIYQQYNTKLPLTEYVCDNEITLPMYGSLTFQQIDVITDTLKMFFNDRN